MIPPRLDMTADANVQTDSVLYKHCDGRCKCNQRCIGGCLQGELRNLVSGAGAMQSGPDGAVACTGELLNVTVCGAAGRTRPASVCYTYIDRPAVSLRDDAVLKTASRHIRDAGQLATAALATVPEPRIAYSYPDSHIHVSGANPTDCLSLRHPWRCSHHPVASTAARLTGRCLLPRSEPVLSRSCALVRVQWCGSVSRATKRISAASSAAECMS